MTVTGVPSASGSPRPLLTPASSPGLALATPVFQRPHGPTLLVQVPEFPRRNSESSSVTPTRPGPSFPSHPSSACALDLKVAPSAQSLWTRRFWGGCTPQWLIPVITFLWDSLLGRATGTRDLL